MRWGRPLRADSAVQSFPSLSGGKSSPFGCTCHYMYYGNIYLNYRLGAAAGASKRKIRPALPNLFREREEASPFNTLIHNKLTFLRKYLCNIYCRLKIKFPIFVASLSEDAHAAAEGAPAGIRRKLTSPLPKACAKDGESTPLFTQKRQANIYCEQRLFLLSVILTYYENYFPPLQESTPVPPEESSTTLRCGIFYRL